MPAETPPFGRWLRMTRVATRAAFVVLVAAALTLVAAPAANAVALPFPGDWSMSGASGGTDGSGAFVTGPSGLLPAPPSGGTWAHYVAASSAPGHWMGSINTSTSVSTTTGSQYLLTWEQYTTAGAQLGYALGHAGSGVTLPNGAWASDYGLFVASGTSTGPTFSFSADTDGAQAPEAGLANVQLVEAEPTIDGPSTVAAPAGATRSAEFPVTYTGGCGLGGAAPAWASVALSADHATCVLTVAPGSAVAGAFTFDLQAQNVQQQPVASHSVTVNVAPVVDHIVVSPSTASVTAGTTQAFAVRAYAPDGTDLGDVTSASAFSSTGSASCTANTCGSTTAGSYPITATYRGHTATATLTVTAAAVDHVVLSPASASIAAGTVQDYSAETVDEFGNHIADVTSETVFTITGAGTCVANACGSTRAAVYTVNGYYRPIGTATAAASAPAPGLSASSTLAVTPGPLEQLVLSPASASIHVGQRITYRVEGFDAYHNSLGDLTRSTHIVISSPGSCTGAVCTAAAPGRYTVTATRGSLSDTAGLTVLTAAASPTPRSTTSSTPPLANTGSAVAVPTDAAALCLLAGLGLLALGGVRRPRGRKH